jgi:hypothetical protein
MLFDLELTGEAKHDLDVIKRDNPAKLKKVLKTLGLMETNLRHPSLYVHEYTSKKGPDNERVWEACVENKTPEAYRVFWYYCGSRPGTIVVFA